MKTIFEIKIITLITIVIFLVFTIRVLIFVIKDIRSTEDAVVPKRKGTLGLKGFLATFFWLMLTILWGGIFWW